MNSHPVPLDSSDDAAASAFDQLVAEYLAAEETGGDARLDTWLRRAGPWSAQFAAFVRDHRHLRRIADIDTPAGGRDTNSEAATLNWATATHLPASLSNLTAATLLNEGGAEFGDYHLLQEIARGGMGVVYRARHRKLNRVVALKMILSGELAGPEDVERFEKEATAAAQLDHPGIVPVFEVGEHAGRHFFTMPLIEGPNLAQRIAAQPLTPRQAAAFALKIAQAVACAHSKGIIHRDLKPANVLIARVDSTANAAGSPSLATLVGGEPKVTDFGLAKRISSEHGLTVTGQVVGTPSYMSPEQAAGRTAEVGPASDIYSIGAILYEMLTGRPPFRAATPIDTMIQVIETQPVPPQQLNPATGRDLQVICLKCLEKSAAHRYGTAEALADDLQRFLEGEPIQARSLHLFSRVTHAIIRRRHEEEFSGWGRAITLLGLIVLVTHLVMFGLELADFAPLFAYWCPRFVMFGMLAATIALHRPQSLLPTNAAERLIWAIWIAFFLGLGAENLGLAVTQQPHHLSYAATAILGGMCFFVMGVHVWGACFVIGLSFFALSPILAATPRFASLVYGLMWGVAFTLLGTHYWSRGKS